MTRKTKNSAQPQTTKRKINKKRLILSLCLIVVLVIAGSGIYLGVRIYQETDGLDVDKLVTEESSSMLSADGKVFYNCGMNGTTNKNVTYDELPQVLIEAVV